MSWVANTIRSTLGRKLVMAITGLGLILFLIAHLIGNMMLYIDDGGATFNLYAHSMAHNPVIYVFEAIIFAGFLFHIVDGIMLTVYNKKSRPVQYHSKKSADSVTWSSRNMGILGGILLIFIVLHLANFFAKSKILEPGPETIQMVNVDGTMVRDLYGVVQESFSVWWYSAIYVVCMIALGLHLYHGFESAFRTLGMSHKKYAPFVSALGIIYSIVVPALFASMPVYFFLTSNS